MESSAGFEHGLAKSEQFASVWLKEEFSERSRRNGWRSSNEPNKAFLGST